MNQIVLSPKRFGKSHKKWALLMVLPLSLAAFGLVGYVRQPLTTPVMRGYRVAQEMGCFACHRQTGAPEGIFNPNSTEGEIPSFNAGGSFLYYVQNPDEIREWILKGVPQRLEKEGRRPPGQIHMPAFQGRLTESQLSDLIAYVKSIALPEKPLPDEAAKGQEIASRLGCFGCHGTGGQAGFPNPGSFKVYIPPWDGKDFAEVVQNDEEMKEWILEGKIHRFESNPLAKYFTGHQAIQMPPYKNLLKDGEVKTLVSYIRWLRDPRRESRPGWIDPQTSLASETLKRGEWLFRSSGCAACHGDAGQGDVRNPNASGGFVPSLNDLAEKMGLSSPDQTHQIVSLIESDANLESLRLHPPIPRYEAFLDQYRKYFGVIVRGSRPFKEREKDSDPPMLMPSWKNRMHGDSGPLAGKDIDAILAYLLTLQPRDEANKGDL